MPQYLSDVNIPESAIPDLVKGAMTQARLWANNPRKFTPEDMAQVYRNMAVRPGSKPVKAKKAPARDEVRAGAQTDRRRRTPRARPPA